MQITYFIGNGFDLAMGLKTAYIDFIDVYKDKTSLRLCIDTFKRLIKSDLETWSSAEEALGKCTHEYTISNYLDFCACYDNFHSEMTQYFAKQDSLCKKPISKKTCKAFQDALFKLGNLKFHPENFALASSLSDQLAESRHYSFVNFNYTRVFDRCLQHFCTSEGVYTHEVDGTYFGDTFGQVLHIHGTYDELMVMGVNDETQITNADLASFEDVRTRIIKPEINGALNATRILRFQSIITESDVIILFGMSIGPTDKTWWIKIGQWLKSDLKHQLLIFIYRPDLRGANPGQYIIAVRKTQKQFLQNADISPTEYNTIRPRIQIMINYPLFGDHLFNFKQPPCKTAQGTAPS